VAEFLVADEVAVGVLDARERVEPALAGHLEAVGGPRLGLEREHLEVLAAVDRRVGVGEAPLDDGRLARLEGDLVARTAAEAAPPAHLDDDQGEAADLVGLEGARDDLEAAGDGGLEGDPAIEAAAGVVVAGDFLAAGVFEAKEGVEVLALEVDLVGLARLHLEGIDLAVAVRRGLVALVGVGQLALDLEQDLPLAGLAGPGAGAGAEEHQGAQDAGDQPATAASVHVWLLCVTDGRQSGPPAL